jgi:hypothetical protein
VQRNVSAMCACAACANDRTISNLDTGTDPFVGGNSHLISRSLLQALELDIRRGDGHRQRRRHMIFEK